MADNIPRPKFTPRDFPDDFVPKCCGCFSNGYLYQGKGDGKPLVSFLCEDKWFFICKSCAEYSVKALSED